MNRVNQWNLLMLLLWLSSAVNAQTFTMNQECRDAVAAAGQMNLDGDHAAALTAFDALVGECKTKDAKERIQVGRARALNGLQRHEAAIEAADAALEVTGDKSLDAYFERALAQEKLGRLEAAQADYDRIIELTEKNQNVSERATLYAKVADMNYRAGKPAEARAYIENAMELDPDNPDYYLQRGDWASMNGDYSAARDDYDRAMQMAPGDVDVYRARAESSLRRMQEKYGTTEAGKLRTSMSASETEQVCGDLEKALELGLRDMKLDMFAALVCR